MRRGICLEEMTSPTWNESFESRFVVSQVGVRNSVMIQGADEPKKGSDKTMRPIIQTRTKHPAPSIGYETLSNLFRRVSSPLNKVKEDV